MITFIPYASFRFFVLIAVLLAPVIILGLKGKRSTGYNGVVGCVMLFLIFASTPRQLVSLIVFLVWQLALINAYLHMRRQSNRAVVFYVAVVLAVLPLFLVKLSADVPSLSFLGFLGISYVSFRSIELVMNIRDGVLKHLSLWHVFRFIAFFPTISSGPIDRFRRFEKDAEHVPSGAEYKEMLYQGMNKIFLGFLYKYIIGYLVRKYGIESPMLFSNSIGSIWLYMYAYSMYLFFDFAGYSQFAIGVSYILGIKTPENFNKPFLSHNMKDFWNRWHISLSFWFRDFVYMRFVYTAVKHKWLKNRYLIADIGIFLNFLVMGFWHGFMVQYIIYGIYHAVAFITADRFERFNKKHRVLPKDNKWIHAAAVVLTFHVICFSFLIFSGRLNFIWQ
ncbi:MAG: D-alanyl-lipoteichoic acid biosynthesis protein DltB [Sporolactobacillus sp.]